LPIIVGGTCYYGYNLFVRKSNQLSEFEHPNSPNSDHSQLEKEFENLKLALKSTDGQNKTEQKRIENKLGEILEKIDKFAFEMTRHNTKKYSTFINSFFKNKQTIKGHQGLIFNKVTFKI